MSVCTKQLDCLCKRVTLRTLGAQGAVLRALCRVHAQAFRTLQCAKRVFYRLHKATALAVAYANVWHLHKATALAVAYANVCRLHKAA